MSATRSNGIFQRSLTQESDSEPRAFLSGPNTILASILKMGRFGASRDELLAAHATSASFPTAKTCLSYLLSCSLIEEVNVTLFRSQFGAASKSLLFTTVKGFGFLQNYFELSRLAGNLGEIRQRESDPYYAPLEDRHSDQEDYYTSSFSELGV
jgi:hypothetical protein